VAVILPDVISRRKRPAGDDDGPADSEQSTLNINPQAPGWTKRLVLSISHLQNQK
jgi:hypothetical protein